jgi:agmatinase
MDPTPDNFLGLEAQHTDPAKATYVVLPVPYEGTVTYEAGTADGPAAIIDASQQVELFDEQLQRECVSPGVATLPPLAPAATADEMMECVYQASLPILKGREFLLTLGGEHSITAPLVQAAQEAFGDVSVLQIDAHADLRDSYDGSSHNHACVMRRVLETTDRLCQVGVRNVCQEEFDQCWPQIERLITPEIVETDPAWIDRAMGLLGETVYITVDVDGFDPSIAPGVGTPEPGGLLWRPTLDLLRRVCAERKVVAADIVEVRPIPPNHITEFLAARLAYKLIAYTQT